MGERSRNHARSGGTRQDSCCSETGAGTVLMAGFAVLVLVMVGVVVLLLQASAAASKAATAADLAALAAADAARGLAPGDPCAVAGTVAEQHGARITECGIGTTGPGTAIIRVSVDLRGLLPDATGAARAGPPS